VPDGYIAIDGQPGLFESKFNSGRLSRRQEQAMQQLGDRYRLDSFLSRDIAALTGIPLGNLAQHLTLARLQDEER
jgi:DNA-directed RNA polymerase specialized sigma24 family protein